MYTGSCRFWSLPFGHGPAQRLTTRGFSREKTSLAACGTAGAFSGNLTGEWTKLNTRALSQSFRPWIGSLCNCGERRVRLRLAMGAGDWHRTRLGAGPYARACLHNTASLSLLLRLHRACLFDNVHLFCVSLCVCGREVRSSYPAARKPFFELSDVSNVPPLFVCA